MASLNYNCHQICRAVEILVKDEGDIRNRLFGQAAFELGFLEPDVFPESWRKDIRWIKKMLLRYPAKQIFRDTEVFRSSCEETFLHTRTVTAKKIVARIWTFYCRLDTLDDEIRNSRRERREM